MARISTNEAAWVELFKRYGILDGISSKGYFQISSMQINEVREARLMAKFDTKESLPGIFRKSSLNIIAISNGQYLIFYEPGFGSFLSLPNLIDLPIKPFYPAFDFPLDTLLFNTEMSESKAIDFAHHSGLLGMVNGESNLKLTSRGRFYSKEFKFDLTERLTDVVVKGVQIEVDGGYESPNSFLLLEAKCGTRSTFNVRQLYFPLKHYERLTNKPIKPILLFYSNGVYYLLELGFSEGFSKPDIIGISGYQIEIGRQSPRISLKEILQKGSIPPPNLPFPQADDLDKVIDLLNFLMDGGKDKFEIADRFEFDPRQGDYYGNAACYLRLAERDDRLFKPTKEGKKLIMTLNRTNRNDLMAEAIFKTPIFHQIAIDFITVGRSIEDRIIEELIQNSGYSGVTAHRRLSTVKSWLKWIEVNFLKTQ